MTQVTTIENRISELIGGANLCDDQLTLQLDQCRIRIRSNSTALIEKLAAYFSHVGSNPDLAADIEILAIDRAEPELSINFVDWKREPGKTGRKDSYFDLDNHRLVRKVRTGMVFLQGPGVRIAAGPCIRYDNQVINFINAQYMNWLQQQDWLICHAAALIFGNQALAIAGFSGGGKSTLMLHMLENENTRYLTNDRLFIRQSGSGPLMARGIPKLPRVNPGTIVHNKRLHPLISPEQRQSLLQMPADELWHLEEKYDVMIDACYGPDRIQHEAELSAVLILNWKRDSDAPPRLEPVDISTRHDLLPAVMKSPGPFYQRSDNSFMQDDTGLDEQAYIDRLAHVRIFEATGSIDFQFMAERCYNEMTSP